MALGFPYFLLAMALLVPRFIRDGIYGWIARNRYLWFGKRDVCLIPTEDIADRFADRNEPKNVPASHDEKVARIPGTSFIPTGFWACLRAAAIRFGIVYVLLYIAPFPLTQLSVLFQTGIVQKTDAYIVELGWAEPEATPIAAALGEAMGAHGQLMETIFPWIGDQLGLEVSFTPSGSGDRMYNYIDLLFDAVVALVICLLWTLIRRGRPVSSIFLGFSRIMARYYLATFMIIYGWIKLFPLQFPVPGPDRLIQSYGDSSPMGLAWTFIGAGTGYQIFSGCAELFGGYLLFFRRTTLIGSLIATAVLINVAAINFFYDVPVKLFSTNLILISLFLAAPALPRLAGLFLFNTPVAPLKLDPVWARTRFLPQILLLLKLAFIGAVTYGHIDRNTTSMDIRGPWAERSPLTGIYRVESMVRDDATDREIEDDKRWVRLGLSAPTKDFPFGAVTIQVAAGDSERMRISMDLEKKTAGIHPRGGEAPETPLDYSEPEPGVLLLTGPFEDSRITVRMRKQEEDPLLTGRGFHWVNEFPYNR